MLNIKSLLYKICNDLIKNEAAANLTSNLTGQLKLSFKSIIAIGRLNKFSSSTSFASLISTIRYSSGALGSHDMGSSSSVYNNQVIDWLRNFIWIPHRSGGVNGATSGDNCNYGSLISCSKNNLIKMRYSGGAIGRVDRLSFVPNRNEERDMASATLSNYEIQDFIVEECQGLVFLWVKIKCIAYSSAFVGPWVSYLNAPPPSSKVTMTLLPDAPSKGTANIVATITPDADNASILFSDLAGGKAGSVYYGSIVYTTKY